MVSKSTNNNKTKNTGTFNLILGSMWSGKTSELIRRYNRHKIGGKNVIMIKYKGDVRYDSNLVVTHDKVQMACIVCSHLYEVDLHIINNNYDVICIDEIQFYKDAHIFADKWANAGMIVEACGLNGTFNRTEFSIISKLLPLVEDITFLKAVCRETGNDAVYSNINIEVDKGVTEVIGGDDKYNAVDRKTFFDNKDFYTLDLIKDFLGIYANSLGLNYIDKDEELKLLIEDGNIDLNNIAKKLIK
jgi:thymidine kinase